MVGAGSISCHEWAGFHVLVGPVGLAVTSAEGVRRLTGIRGP